LLYPHGFHTRGSLITINGDGIFTKRLKEIWISRKELTGRELQNEELHDYWVSGLCPSSGILNTREHNVSETGSVSFLRSGGKTPTQLGPFERANFQ
jgi:hypothetical protein